VGGSGDRKVARDYDGSDNTCCQSYLQRPIEFGFDIVVHSATKSKISERTSDMVGAFVAVKMLSLGTRLAYLHNAWVLWRAFDSFLDCAA